MAGLNRTNLSVKQQARSSTTDHDCGLTCEYDKIERNDLKDWVEEGHMQYVNH